MNMPIRKAVTATAPIVRAPKTNPCGLQQILQKTYNPQVPSPMLLAQQAERKRCAQQAFTDKRLTTPTSETMAALEKMGWSMLQKGNPKDPMILWMPQAICRDRKDQAQLHQSQLRALKYMNQRAYVGSISVAGLSAPSLAELNNLPPLKKIALQQCFDKFCDTPFDQLTNTEKEILALMHPAMLFASTQESVPVLDVHPDVDTFQKQYMQNMSKQHDNNPYAFQLLFSFAPYEPRGTLTPLKMPSVQVNVGDTQQYVQAWRDMAKNRTLPGGNDMAEFHIKDFQYREILPTETIVEPYLGIKTVLAAENRTMGGAFGVPPHIVTSLQKYWDARQILTE